MRCPHCGSRITTKNIFCPECGADVVWQENYKQKEEQKRNPTIVVVLGVLLFVALIAICVLLPKGNSALPKTPAAKEIPQEATQATIGFSDDPAAISETANSVVKLNCYNGNGELICSGSGFAAFEEGVIVTNYHVIKDYPNRIEIETETGQKFDIFGGIGASKERDIAILYYSHRSSDIKLPLLTIGSSKELKKGEKVIAIGSPLGLTNVVSSGIFSSYANVGPGTDLQFTASISSGSSGGALFNNKGEVIGITYASIEAGQNMNLAVPIEFVQSLWRTASSSRSDLSSFNDSLIPHYSVDYVLKNYSQLQDMLFYLDVDDCWVSSYGDSNSSCIICCTDDSGKTVNALCHRATSDFARMQIDMKIKYSVNGLKCKGTGWSERDNLPYVILD